MGRYAGNKRNSIKRFNRSKRRTRGENKAIMRGGWRL